MNKNKNICFYFILGSKLKNLFFNTLSQFPYPWQLKKLSFCHKIKFLNRFIFATLRCKLRLFNLHFRLQSLKYLRSTILGCNHKKGTENLRLWQNLVPLSCQAQTPCISQRKKPKSFNLKVFSLDIQFMWSNASFSLWMICIVLSVL